MIGTADLRLQTITLIGSKDLIKTAEKYVKSLDVRHRQVALTIKILDVNLTKTDIKDNIFELRTGDTRIINNSGLGFGIGNNNTYKTACKYSSGAIIGSAFIKHIKRNGVKSTKDFISEITE